MSLKGDIETYTIEQKIEGYKLFSDTSCSYRIRDHENKLVKGTWQIFYSGDSEPLSIVFSTDIEKREVKALDADKIVDYVLIRGKKNPGGITRDLQNEIKQNNDLKGYSKKKFNPTPSKLILKLKPEALKLDPRTLWAATVVLQGSYKIAPFSTVHVV